MDRFVIATNIFLKFKTTQHKSSLFFTTKVASSRTWSSSVVTYHAIVAEEVWPRSTMTTFAPESAKSDLNVGESALFKIL